jgi:SAM-dependent methyltransferase
MEGDDLDNARYARMRWNVPLSEEHAGLLIDRLSLRPGARVVDLGCGWGELLLRVVASTDQAIGTGVDTDARALGRARRRAADRHLDRQVLFAEADIAGWAGPADRVLCVGASHALGGTTAALTALTGAAPAGSRLLFGEGYWEKAPSAAAVEMFGAEVRPLAGLLEACRSTGWRVLHLSVADQREWDDFESSFRAGRQEWLLAHAADPRAAEVRDWLDDRERQYLEVYRGVLGFAYLVLAQEEVIGLAPDHPDQTAPDQTAPDQTAPEQSEEDTDAGWGERPEPGDDERLYGERPPHWE